MYISGRRNTQISFDQSTGLPLLNLNRYHKALVPTDIVFVLKW